MGILSQTKFQIHNIYDMIVSLDSHLAISLQFLNRILNIKS